MNKIPSLQQILPQSPDDIQRFSSEASAAPARMSHLNRAALYFGMDAEFIEIDFSVTQNVFINKPSGHINILNINVFAGLGRRLFIIWDSALFQAAKNVNTPYYAQFTAVSDNSLNAVYPVTIPQGTYDAGLELEYYSTNGATDASFFYSLIPQ